MMDQTRIEKQCPHCKEMIHQKAGLCPHCRQMQFGWFSGTLGFFAMLPVLLIVGVVIIAVVMCIL